MTVRWRPSDSATWFDLSKYEGETPVITCWRLAFRQSSTCARWQAHFSLCWFLCSGHLSQGTSSMVQIFCSAVSIVLTLLVVFYHLNFLIVTVICCRYETTESFDVVDCTVQYTGSSASHWDVLLERVCQSRFPSGFTLSWRTRQGEGKSQAIRCSIMGIQREPRPVDLQQRHSKCEVKGISSPNTSCSSIVPQPWSIWQHLRIAWDALYVTEAWRVGASILVLLAPSWKWLQPPKTHENPQKPPEQGLLVKGAQKYAIKICTVGLEPEAIQWETIELQAT